MAGCFQKVDAENHRDRRAGAIALHVAALLVALISLSLISRWFLFAVAVLWLFVAGCNGEGADTGERGARR